MRPRWKPEYDALVAALNAAGHNDYGILNHLLDREYPVSLDDVTEARRRLRLRQPPRTTKPEPPGKALKDRPNPLVVAKNWLGSRLEERASGYFLDRVPVNLPTIMKEAYRVLTRSGVTPEDWPEGWR